MKIRLLSRYFLALMLVILTLALAACGSNSAPQPSPSLDFTATSTMANQTPTALPSPTPTATQPPPLVILLASANSDAALKSQYEQQLADLASQSGMQFQTLETLSPGEIKPEMRIVVALPPDPGLAALAAKAASTQFVSVGIAGLQPATNLTQLGNQEKRDDQSGFLAGYIAAMVTPEWRVGMLTLENDPTGKGALTGFLNGVVYYCGLCRPPVPPFLQYPAYYELPAGAGQADQDAAVAYFTSSVVKTVYVYPGAGDEALLTALANAGIKIIGGVEQPAGLEGQWICSIRSGQNSTLPNIWPNLLKGEVIEKAGTSITIDSINEEILSPGKQRMVDELRISLENNQVDTGAGQNDDS